MQKNSDPRSVKSVHAHAYWWLLLAGVIVLIDEWIKFISIQKLPNEGSLIDPDVIELAIHKNVGAAFDLPFPLEFVIFCSILVGVGLIGVIYKHRHKRPDMAIWTVLIILGAMGNLYDRLMYGFTVDYIILFGRSAINLSDLLILLGIILLLLSNREVQGQKGS